MTRSVSLGAAMLLTAALVAAGCASVQGGVQTPAVRLTGLRLLEAGVASQRFELALDVANPNPIPLPIEDLSVSVRLGGAGVLDGRSAAPVVLPAEGTTTLRVEVTSDIVSSVSRLLALATGPDNELAYELNGRLTPSRRLSGPLPFGARGRVPLSLPTAR